MQKLKTLFATKTGMIITGLLIGTIAALLQKLGNPANMGLCVACFTRDIAGALGLHRAAVVQYVRPEIPALILGATISAFAFGEFKARTGSVPIVRFLLGAFAMIGALVFLGCPWRALLRLAGGDLNAVIGLAGLITGVFLGTRFFIAGYNPGASQKTYKAAGLVLPLAALALLCGVIFFPPLKDTTRNGVFMYSLKGPGAVHAPVLISLLAGLFIGFLLQRSRFCTIGGFRDLILFRQTHLISGVVALVAAAFTTNLIAGQFNPGYLGQPIAHTMAFWNFSGMVLAGLAFTLAGGCPGRQCIMAGEGNGDAGLFVLGMLSGAAFAHNFALAASPAGVGINGQLAVMVGIVICLVIGFTLREQA
ncbi:YedE family putative selenium transporter [Candidatus Margulisiibacteriota bacterium]